MHAGSCMPVHPGMHAAPAAAAECMHAGSWNARAPPRCKYTCNIAISVLICESGVPKTNLQDASCCMYLRFKSCTKCSSQTASLYFHVLYNSIVFQLHVLHISESTAAVSDSTQCRLLRASLSSASSEEARAVISVSNMTRDMWREEMARSVLSQNC
jgi:hypothetical protein